MLVEAIGLAALIGGQPQVATGHNTGVWVGSVQLCRDAVVSAEWKRSPSPLVTLYLTNAAVAPLQRQSERLVGKQVTVTINGRTFYQPYVLAPLSSSSFQLPATMDEASQILSLITETTCS
jgi:hypothetical protein